MSTPFVTNTSSGRQVADLCQFCGLLSALSYLCDGVLLPPLLFCSYVAGYGGPAGYTMGYAVGFFPHITSVAYGSDYIMDLIPADVVAAVVLAGAAAGVVSSSKKGAGGLGAVAIYHAASAHSHTATLKLVFDIIGQFWAKNPPPFRLPGTR